MTYNYSRANFKIKKSNCFLRLIAIVALFAGSINLPAQGYWMEKGGGSSADEAYSICSDGSNNTYTTGYFTGTASFGSFNITAGGVSDIFVAKTNSSGVYQWAVKAGDGGSDRGLAITCDASGNSYVTGYYYGTATFGIHSITSAGIQDVFVAKYDNTGAVQWVVSCGGTQSDIGNAIALDNNGNVIVTGQFAGTATFGTYTLTSTANNINVFTTKLNASTGAFLWAESGVGPHTDRGLGVACDPSGNVYITGQYTDSITFTNQYKSNLYNAIFVVKYNPSGVEQWITAAGGGTSNIANAIAVDNSSNVYITGNFTGTLNFIVNPIVTLTQAYSNRIFLAKYSQSGSLLWDVADGSTNPVNANSIALDGSGNPYIIGDFDCLMNSYADHYGQGTFNSVGYWDIYNAEYSSSNGAWQWSRQIGGHGNNYGYGIAVSSAANIFDAGSFDQDMIITESSLLGYNASVGGYCTPTYCSDSYYGDYAYFNTTGNLDAFISEPINLNRQTYDFYNRTGNSCNRPVVGVCVGTGNVCLDSVRFCSSGTVRAITNTCTPIGPNYTYLWSTGSRSQAITVSVTGWYYVTETTADGCFSSKDSIYVTIEKPPPPPTISDNVIINTNSSSPKPIRVCEHSVILTGGNYAGDSTWYWTTPTNIRKDSTKITVTLHSDSGYYCFNVVNKYGCTSQTCVWVAIDSAFPKIIPKLLCTTCRHDTAFLCKGSSFTIFPYDSITNPSINQSFCIPPSSATTNYWYTKPDTGISYSNKTSCPNEKNTFFPRNWDSGWYKITDTIIQSNVCGIKKYVVKDSIYARIYPVPVVNLSIKGGGSLCANDSEWIVGTGNVPFKWSNGSTKDSIHVGVGSYSISATVKNAFGCSASGNASLSITAFTATTPTVTTSPAVAVICPNDSIELNCKGGPFEKYVWYGPSGPLSKDSSSVYVKTAGNYYCVGIDTTPCPISKLSNTIIVESYATPFLQVPLNNNICPGDSIVLTVVASNNAIIKWFPPLSGDSTIQVIKVPGTYSVEITSCGIPTICTTTITKSSPFAIITAIPSKTICTQGDSIELSAAKGMANYLWKPSNDTSQVIYIKKAATYTLTTADIFGCTASANVIISPPLKDSISKAINISCMGSSTGAITLGVSGGLSPYTYSWSPPVTTNASASNLTAGIYSVTVTDGNGCVKTASTTLTQPATLLVSSILASTNIKCYGYSTGLAIDSAHGGEPTYSYLWSPGGQTKSIAKGLSAGAYTVVVTDSAGCSKTSSVNITQPTAIVADLTVKAATCLDTDGAASVSITGGVGPYTYLWNPGGNTNSAITALTPGKYTVITTDANGCMDTTKATVGLDTTLTIIISGADSICNGQSVTLSVTGATTYRWSTGSTSTTITLTPTYNTYIWVKATTGICTDSIPYNLFIYQPLHTIPLNDSICPGRTITLNASLTGGKAAYTYTWNNGITADSPAITVSPTVTTEYKVNINDACNYTTADSFYVKVLPRGTAAFTFTPDSIETGRIVTFTNNSQNTSYYDWLFGDGDTTIVFDPTHIYLNYGTFQITLIGYDSNGCPDTAIKDIYIIPKIYIPNVFTPNGDGVNDLFYFTVQGATCFHANIYNRWGVLIYELNSAAQGCAGIVRQSGEPASDGTYYYILHYCDYQNGTHNLAGFITLIRNKQ